jgi:MFS superfamily sulfate permease-like transporter
MLGAIESLLSAVVADPHVRRSTQSNVELFAQGIANIGVAPVRRAARDRGHRAHGDQHPLRRQDTRCRHVHAVTLLAILVFAAPLAGHVPLPVLAATLIVVAYNMGEWREIREILKLSKGDIAVWLITFALTVFADLTVAVEAGMILAALLYIRKGHGHHDGGSRYGPNTSARDFPHSLQRPTSCRKGSLSTASTGLSCSAPRTSSRSSKTNSIPCPASSCCGCAT